MPPRLHVSAPLAAGPSLALPPEAVRHAQVLRLQPGDALTLFDGAGGEWAARIESMGRRDVTVSLLEHRPVERELPLAITLALAMPAGDRMDHLVEKATELGVAAIQPLITERSVLRLSGERADKRRAHWQAIAVAACEQCGRNRVPSVHAPRPLESWLAALGAGRGDARWLLAWRDATAFVRVRDAAMDTLQLLSGPEGGLTGSEEDTARACGFVPVGLGPRVLRADTAPLAVLAALALRA
ncbi:MAG TPA: 16S rRNA (uracil(1498)-N(3))-methyltransferase [Burkholderiaceae bacterium]|nr:16S rRNA (uracil(1498)-N(3))-methyltransferase [Burkholderiaceae bacterium]